MAVITPDTYVRLMRCDITPEHQLTFSDISAQTNFFNSLSGLEISDFTYQRKDNVIRWAGLYEDIERYNYLVYCNEAQSNKYYYCYITDIKYVNDEMTEIYIDTDVFQTWQFDIIYKEMFIEREHVNSDEVGEHTVPEGLETGEYVVTNTSKTDMGDLVYVIHADKWDTDTPQTSNAPNSTDMGGLPYTRGIMVFDTVSAFNQAIARYRSNNIDTSIWECYVIPRTFLDHDFGTPPNENFYFGGQQTPKTVINTIQKPTNIDGHIPVNNKLLTYPYCYLEVNNNSGASRIYQYEKFMTDDCQFYVKGIPVIGGSIKLTPRYYTQDESSAGLESEGIYAGKFPLLNWNNDTYHNWLQLNGATNLGQTLIGAGQSALGLAGFLLATNPLTAIAGVGVALGGVATMGSTLASYIDHEKLPNSLSGDTTGIDINTCANTNSFYYIRHSIKNEFANIIDKYFSAAGYRVNTIKLPNIEGRLNWNYVKTRDCNIEGTLIPEKDLNKLKAMFNTGITFWHNYSTFRDYSQSNPIV